MGLAFEEEKYESFCDGILYCIFKMGYVSRKYQLYPKLSYTIGTVIEVLLIIYLLSVTQCDIYSTEIREYGNFLNAKFNKNLLYYKNFNNDMSFIINFLDMINKLSQDSYNVGLIIILLMFFTKFVEFCYLLPISNKVINISGPVKVFFYICGLIDMTLKTYGDILILIMSMSIFSCVNGNNYFFNSLVCYQAEHLFLLVINVIILFLTFTNLLYQCTFFDVCNLLEKNNFGLAENLRNEFLIFLSKVILVIFNLFFLHTSQELIKICIYFSINFIILFTILQNITKFHNFYQNLMIFKLSSLFIYSVFIISYSIT